MLVVSRKEMKKKKKRKVREEKKENALKVSYNYYNY